MMDQLPTRPTVFVVDDDIGVRRAIEAMLRLGGAQPVGYGDGVAFLENYQQQPPGCLVLDVRMPTMDGLEVVERLREFSHVPPTIMISGAADISLAVRAMKLGAIDFLTKPISRRRLIAAISAAVMLDKMQPRADLHHRRMQQDKLAHLTSKEHEVLSLLLEGCLNKQIAKRLDLSVRTIELRRASILRKLNVTSVNELLCLLCSPVPLQIATDGSLSNTHFGHRAERSAHALNNSVN